MPNSGRCLRNISRVSYCSNLTASLSSPPAPGKRSDQAGIPGEGMLGSRAAQRGQSCCPARLAEVGAVPLSPAC